MNRPVTGIARPDTRLDGTQFCRVTVCAPRSRMDLALPVDLTVAELVPMLTELAGESTTRQRPRSGTGPGAPGAWCLAAVAGAELPPQATLAGLGVLDGDMLRLRRRSDSPPPPVFDDPVDAVAEAVRSPDGEPDAWADLDNDGDGRIDPFAVRPWNDRCRRPAGLTAAALATVLTAALLAGVRGLGEHASVPAAVIAGLAAAGALIGAMRIVTVDESAGVVLAFGAIPLAAAAGVAALPGTPAAAHLLLACALAAAAASAGLALLGTAAPVLVAAALATVLGAMAALVRVFDIGTVWGLAAGAAAVAIGLLPTLPRVSVRLAGLPPPVIPTTPDEMVLADANWELADPEEVRHQSQLAHTYLAGLVLGCSIVAGVGAVLAATQGGWGGASFSTVVIAVLMLRSRGYVTAAASTAPFVAGASAGTVLAARLATEGSGPAKLGVALALMIAGGIAVWLVWTGPKRESSPVVRRSVDIVEAVLVVATFPLALWVLDLYSAVRGL
ncbi:type VII secretion integral membrane protein EccD [Pseudonocardia spinosispora]|uniref:type VII secretion integral membrane protein EccD n=1 Tax=Pseudonocardia spinosispora TaxID=103441 RepID=UPI00041103C4|nr:type VII secretion integral membrane protein EccD [Pseudonocardia spinosispora]